MTQLTKGNKMSNPKKLGIEITDEHYTEKLLSEHPNSIYKHLIERLHSRFNVVNYKEVDDQTDSILIKEGK